MGQRQQARSSAHKLILQAQAGAKHTASQWQHGVAFSVSLSRIPKRVRRVVWRCKAGATSSKFSVEVTCQLLGFLAADTGILSTVAILRLPRPFACTCTTTLECHSSPSSCSNPPGLQLDIITDTTRSIRNCPHQFAAFHQAQNSRPRHRIVPSTPPPLPQWHLLPSLQQLQAATLVLHAQIRAASGKCFPAWILRHAATRCTAVLQLRDYVSSHHHHCYTTNNLPTVAHHFHSLPPWAIRQPTSCMLTPTPGPDARTVRRKHSAGPHTRPRPLDLHFPLSPEMRLRLAPPPHPRQVLESTYRHMRNRGALGARWRAATREISWCSSSSRRENLTISTRGFRICIWALGNPTPQMVPRAHRGGARTTLEGTARAGLTSAGTRTAAYSPCTR